MEKEIDKLAEISFDKVCDLALVDVIGTMPHGHTQDEFDRRVNSVMGRLFITLHRSWRGGLDRIEERMKKSLIKEQAEKALKANLK